MILLGGVGLGKTHIATALGYEACLKGYSVLFSSAIDVWLIEEFVTREGTDTGYTDGSIEDNIKMVLHQLNRGEAVIVYDEVSQTANIVPADSHKH